MFPIPWIGHTYILYFVLVAPMSLNKILVVIDPTMETQPAFERALESATLTGARLHLYLCSPEQGWTGKLEDMLARAAEIGIEAVSEHEDAADWRRHVVAAAARCSASMVFKNSFEHRDVQRELNATSDWMLLRTCHCPVLLIKDFRDWKSRKVLAAINTASTDQAHIKLNNQIVSFAQEFTEAYGSDAHFVNAYQDRNHAPCKADLSRVCGAPLEHIHIIEGSPSEAITHTAHEIDADLVIIGTVGRDGIKGRVVGNTSEKMLDHTHSDVLVLT
jgi:universal stress protein E